VLEQRGRLRAQLGRPGALEDHREAVRLALVGHPIRGYMLNSLAARLMQIPLPDEAREVAEEALGASHHAGDDPSEAAALIAAGRWDEALECVDHALDHAPPAVYHAHLLCLAGFVDVRRGEVDRAEWALTRARELADVPFAQNPLQLPGLEAEVRLAQGRLDEVAAVVRAALDLPNALVASRFAWPLVALGVRAGAPVPDMPVAVVGASPSPHGTAMAQGDLRRVLATSGASVVGASVVGEPVVVGQAFRQFDEHDRLLDHELRAALAGVLVELTSRVVV
jgi:tetratricopeptide (TPR) repeat protein